MIQIKQLSYKYKTAKEPVLKGVDFEVKSGKSSRWSGKTAQENQHSGN